MMIIMVITAIMLITMMKMMIYGDHDSCRYSDDYKNND